MHFPLVPQLSPHPSLNIAPDLHGTGGRGSGGGGGGGGVLDGAGGGVVAEGTFTMLADDVCVGSSAGPFGFSGSSTGV